MKSRYLLTGMFSAALLAGCVGLSGLPLTGGASVSQAGQAALTDTLSALQAEEDSRMSASMVGQSGATTQSLGATASLSIEASASLRASCDCDDESRAQRIEARAKDRWEHEKGVVRTFTRNQVTNADGSITTTISAQFETRGLTRDEQMVLTVSASGSLEASKIQIQSESRSGIKVDITRTMTRNADGTVTISFSRTAQRPDGKTVSVSWTRTEDADGSSTGEGEITAADGTTGKVTITADASGDVVARDVDDADDVAVEVDKVDLDATASTKITTASSGKVIASSEVSDTTSVNSDDQ